MVTSLFKYEQIETTDAKAKAIRPVAEKMITLAKRGDLHSRRQALAYINEKAVTHKLFDELKNRYLEKQGGYVRIVSKGIRKGDGAPVSIVQLISADDIKSAYSQKSSKKNIESNSVTVVDSGKDKSVNTQQEVEVNEQEVKDNENSDNAEIK
jgi:large subunit ribosomal protein L17